MITSTIRYLLLHIYCGLLSCPCVVLAAGVVRTSKVQEAWQSVLRSEDVKEGQRWGVLMAAA